MRVRRGDVVTVAVSGDFGNGRLWRSSGLRLVDVVRAYRTQGGTPAAWSTSASSWRRLRCARRRRRRGARRRPAGRSPDCAQSPPSTTDPSSGAAPCNRRRRTEARTSGRSAERSTNQRSDLLSASVIADDYPANQAHATLLRAARVLGRLALRQDMAPPEAQHPHGFRGTRRDAAELVSVPEPGDGRDRESRRYAHQQPVHSPQSCHVARPARN